MTAYADLEILFRKRDERSYSLSFRYSSPDDEADHPSQIEPVIVLDAAALKLTGDAAYAQALTSAFFTPEVRNEFTNYRNLTQQKSATLRVRLSIDSSAPELHGVRWETLRDPALPPEQNISLFTGEQIIFSRFLTSGDWRPIRLHPKAQLRALAVIANPASAAEFQLAPIDVAAELAQVRAALGGISISLLAPGGAVPLNDLAAKLREGFDILYLVCHGCLVDQEPYLFLSEGRPERGLNLVQAMRELDQRPRMVVLASCQSAGKGEASLAGLGPRLAEAGIPAVIAMQGNVFMSTAAAFMKRFFTELLVDGQIDRAMSVARGEVRDASDYWMPVLFMRLRNGRIWYEPRFGGSSEEEAKSWKDIYAAVRERSFIPVLGPELGEEIFGGTHEWASSLADRFAFPLGSHDRSDLSKVTQFLSVKKSFKAVCREVELESTRRLIQWLGMNPPQPEGAESDDEAAALEREQLLLDVRPTMQKLAVNRCVDDEDSPLRILASLPASIYLNASYETLLRDVLSASSKAPEMIAVPWLRGDVPQMPQPVSSPRPATPWDYHIFGHFEDRTTMVLTEDNFFDYLIQSTRLDLIKPLAGRLMEGSLIFLGFRLDDWRFRVLFRMIVGNPGSSQLRQQSHVGVQVNPAEQSVADANRTVRYMEEYFSASNAAAPRISIYWGSAADFLRQLRDKTMARPSPGGTP
jgi:hypothetical protein